MKKKLGNREPSREKKFAVEKICKQILRQKKLIPGELRLPAAAGPPRHLPAAGAAAPRLPAASREADPAAAVPEEPAAAPERGSSGVRRAEADPAARGGGELGSGGGAARDGPFLPDPAGAELARRRGRRRHGSAGGMARRRGQRGCGSAGRMARRRRRKGEREERKGKG